ncbi:hypothetical protein VTL71DRAFT_3355 [Oculimacula yallundae]|uniref:Amidohydrolase-related domain-containing protein n=1 Tax=Oculimacula yallundae TaxID=86028 RepID=A0ABR4C6X5_9HELO
MYKQSDLNLAPNAPSRQYRPKLPVSIITVVALILGLQFVVLPRYVYQLTPSEIRLTQFQLNLLDEGLRKCEADQTPPIRYPTTTASSRTNARWNPTTGQNDTVILRNATLFDGERIFETPVDIVFKKGIIESVSDASDSIQIPGAKVVKLDSKFVTPGLVDMHSHHLSNTWPMLSSTDDTNEMNPAFGPLTPFVRIIDSLKAYDYATTVIASGGVTTSLILPGSANIMGGEAVVVKNVLKSGENEEFVVEDLLLEHGEPVENRRRYMKMACGENPRRVYKHTRMGNAYLFRKQMERANELKGKQDAWCLKAAALRDDGNVAAISNFLDTSSKDESATDYLEFDSSIAMLRGKVGINIHCYEPEDFEDMIKHSKEFGFRIQAFHHALSAWQVPEMLKASGENITIATFSEFGFYKKEAYEANLWAGKILADHEVPVAYKSDHVEPETNAKYLLFQAATAHSFHLSELLALQSVTSVPAHSMQVDHRVGYAKAGYDADLVVWDSHPLLVGATALQVYIDGKPTLDPKKVEESLSNVESTHVMEPRKPSMRALVSAKSKNELCSEVEKAGSKFTVAGIKKSYLEGQPRAAAESDDFTLVVESGKIVCFDSKSKCASISADSPIISLKNGHVLPGLIAVTTQLGLAEISTDSATSDGEIKKSAGFDPKLAVYAKYGVHLEGKGFARARIGGVTRAISAPMSAGFTTGVSTGIKTSGKKTILNGGVFQDDVALHFSIGQDSKGTDSLPTISSEILKLREIIDENKSKDNIYGKAANGTIPLVIHADNEYDIMQLIKIKQDYPELNLVVYGGYGAALVATELAEAKIPVILTANRGAPAFFEDRRSLPGPPLSRSPAAVLTEAGVKYALSIFGEGQTSHIHNIPIEAGWAAKYAGLSAKQAVDLVSRNVVEILGLSVEEAKKDFVVWEGNPLEFGASVVVGVDGEDGAISMCWPEAI